MTRYVLGFLFTRDFRQVVLLQKTHGPGEMAGKLNGIGGHVEESDVTTLAAMHRETLEELGVIVEWLPFCTMHDSGKAWVCDCFVAEMLGALDLPRRTDVGEIVNVVDFDRARTLGSPMMKNLEWLVPMAAERSGLTAEVYYPSGSRGDV